MVDINNININIVLVTATLPSLSLTTQQFNKGEIFHHILRVRELET